MTEQQKQPNWFVRHKILTVILVIFALAVIGNLAGGGKEPDTNKTQSPTTSTEQPKQDEPAPTKWDLEAAYAKITNGMTKAQVEEATGKKSESCTESQSEYIGKTEFCTYGNAFTDKGTITVTYSQDVVSSKTKSNY